MVAAIKENRLYGDNVELINRDSECAVYKIADETGDGIITSYPVFNGIDLVYYDMHMQSFGISSFQGDNILQINHCQEGRIEYEFNNGEYLYLAKGDLSVQKKCSGCKYSYFPLSHYHGISVMIDLEKSPKCLSCILDDVMVSPEKLCKKFCGNKFYTVMRENESIEHIFSELYSVPENIKKGYQKVKVLELMLFLRGTEVDNSNDKHIYFTKAQVTAAKQAKKYLIKHLDERITVADLANIVEVSQTTLKMCFKGVYGESIYAYMKNYKMQKAAALLKTTDESVLDIASAVGYNNGSKFASAFKSVMKATPNEYRKSAVQTEHYLSKQSRHNYYSAV